MLLLSLLLASAHERMPSHLTAVHAPPGWVVELRVPLVAERALDLSVEPPLSCEPVGVTRQTLMPNALVMRQELRCASLDGLSVGGLAKTSSDVLVEIEGHPSTVLHGGASSWHGQHHGWIRRGVHHILEGPDHLLFLLGLLLAVPNRRMLIWTVSAFTVSHSLALALGALGWVPLSAGAVEVLIALSVLLLATHLSRAEHLDHPERLALGAGLLHGLGFAGALTLLELPREQLLGAVFRFNLGVELGQLAVVAVALILLRFAPDAARRPLVLLLGSASVYWLLQRLASWM